MKQETLEEAAEKYVDNKHKPAAGIPNKGIKNFYDCKNAFKDGAKWQAEKSYSEEDLISLLEFNYKKETNQLGTLRKDYSQKIVREWFEQFKKK